MLGTPTLSVPWGTRALTIVAVGSGIVVEPGTAVAGTVVAVGLGVAVGSSSPPQDITNSGIAIATMIQIFPSDMFPS
jgi:hypothetical protein